MVFIWKYNCLFKINLNTKDKNRHNFMNKKSDINLILTCNSVGSLLCTETRFENVYKGEYNYK